jgi:hypothetical protein
MKPLTYAEYADLRGFSGFISVHRWMRNFGLRFFAAFQSKRGFQEVHWIQYALALKCRKEPTSACAGPVRTTEVPHPSVPAKISG